jgi:hypothetical protein
MKTGLTNTGLFCYILFWKGRIIDGNLDSTVEFLTDFKSRSFFSGRTGIETVDGR